MWHSDNQTEKNVRAAMRKIQNAKQAYNHPTYTIFKWPRIIVKLWIRIIRNVTKKKKKILKNVT